MNNLLRQVSSWTGYTFEKYVINFTLLSDLVYISVVLECCVQSWTSPGSNTPQDTNCTATCLLSRKLFKLEEPDMQDTAGEVGTNT